MLEFLIVLLVILYFAYVTMATIISYTFRKLHRRFKKKPKFMQRRITEYVMSDEYPYLKRYTNETVEDMELELYGESTAELDLQDEEAN
jgi:hypothetical protein